MRAFIAVNLEKRTQEELAGMQRELDKRVRGFRWVKSELLHITLRFLGELNPRDVDAIAGALTESGEKIRPFTLSFSGIGAFPTVKRPRIIWIGVKEGATELAGLAYAIDTALQKVCPLQKKDKDFSFRPHLTLGRAKRNEPAIIPPDVFAGEWRRTATLQVVNFFLMESVLYPSGPVYKPVQKFLLK